MSRDAVMDHFATHVSQAILLSSELSQLYIPNPRNGELRREVEQYITFRELATSSAETLSCPDSKLGAFRYDFIGDCLNLHGAMDRDYLTSRQGSTGTEYGSFRRWSLPTSRSSWSVNRITWPQAREIFSAVYWGLHVRF